MNIRPAVPSDLEWIAEIDSVIESSDYLHLERTGEGLAAAWRLEPRPLREKQIAANPLSDDTAFTLKQIVTGTDEGVAIIAEHDEKAMALLLAQRRPEFGTIELIDLRVDFDVRRQGIATVLLFQLIQAAKDQDCRAVTCKTLTNNTPAARLLLKTGWELSGLDTRRFTNHDWVEERATLIWYCEVT